MGKEGTRVFGTVLSLLADAIGGFKVGVGWALRKCRICMATKEQTQHLVKLVF